MSPARAPRARRWWWRGVAAVAGAITLMLVTLTIAMFVDDARIDADPVRATGTVLTVSALRTGIEFVDAQGRTIRPSAGVLYPGLLQVGQQFVVEYSAASPDTVRVAGRTARNGLVMVLAAAVISWLIATPLLVWLGRLARRRGRDLHTVG
ncbi:MAG: DUF3592 domain-containing protein [Nakamurella sp.]